jgi:hypothetical protein
VSSPGAAPVNGIRERLRWALEHIDAILGNVLWPGGVATLIAEREPEFTRVVPDLLEPYNRALSRLIEDDVADGRLRTSTPIAWCP